VNQQYIEQGLGAFGLCKYYLSLVWQSLEKRKKNFRTVSFKCKFQLLLSTNFKTLF
jgi:hypothetical protein